jgi:hypothetical protein
MSRKNIPYRERYTSDDSGLQIWTMIPGISIVIFPPIYIGYRLATLHDNLLYTIWPAHYQQQINDFIEEDHIQNKKDNISCTYTGGSGNPQITYF